MNDLLQEIAEMADLNGDNPYPHADPVKGSQVATKDFVTQISRAGASDPVLSLCALIIVRDEFDFCWDQVEALRVAAKRAGKLPGIEEI